MRPLTVICVLLFVAGRLAAQTNDPAATQRCLARMDELIDQLTVLEQNASNETARAECIAGKRNKLKGLRELTASAAGRLPALIADEDTEAISAEQSAITIACARADKIAAEAALCDEGPPVKTKKRHAATDAAAPPPARPSSTSSRDEENCLKQSRLAQLLLQAMELGPDPQKPTRIPTEELARFAIEPLHGWKPDDCATLDDLCVVVARALNLKVEKPNDSASCCQALREEALPVDVYFPPRFEGADSPLLLETEVRAFLSKGYAAPLPSSRRLVPE